MDRREFVKQSCVLCLNAGLVPVLLSGCQATHYVAGVMESSGIALSKSEIDRLKERFDRKEPGFFDDSEWWQLVEQADRKPVPGLKKCPSCMLESPEGSEECANCGHDLSRSPDQCAECGEPVATEAANPDFTALSDGSHFAKDLEDVK